MSHPIPLDPAVVDYAVTDWQRKVLQELLNNGGSISEAARTLGVNKSRVFGIRKSCEKRYQIKQAGPISPTSSPDSPFNRVGDTTLYGADGEAKLQWVKRRLDDDKRTEAMREAVQAMCEDVPRMPPVRAPRSTQRDLMCVYPMGDPHFGMYAWAAETGDAFDLDIAERDLCAAVDWLVDRAPPAERGVLVNLGDFFHAENMAGVTTQSGHALDMDTRLQKVQDVGVRALRRCIDRMLEKHKTIHVINAPGNHDTVLAHFLNVLLRNLYERTSRVTIYDAPTTRHYVEHGRCLVGVTHGDKTSDRDLPGIMATEQPEAWGRTKHRFYLRGHHHHDSRVEYNGCIVEQFRTLAARDAYTVGQGYLSGRDMKCLVLHREWGEQMRLTCGIDVLR